MRRFWRASKIQIKRGSYQHQKSHIFSNIKCVCSLTTDHQIFYLLSKTSQLFRHWPSSYFAGLFRNALFSTWILLTVRGYPNVRLKPMKMKYVDTLTTMCSRQKKKKLWKLLSVFTHSLLLRHLFVDKYLLFCVACVEWHCFSIVSKFDNFLWYIFLTRWSIILNVTHA